MKFRTTLDNHILRQIVVGVGSAACTDRKKTILRCRIITCASQRKPRTNTVKIQFRRQSAETQTTLGICFRMPQLPVNGSTNPGHDPRKYCFVNEVAAPGAISALRRSSKPAKLRTQNSENQKT